MRTRAIEFLQKHKQEVNDFVNFHRQSRSPIRAYRKIHLTFHFHQQRLLHKNLDPNTSTIKNAPSTILVIIKHQYLYKIFKFAIHIDVSNPLDVHHDPYGFTAHVWGDAV